MALIAGRANLVIEMGSKFTRTITWLDSAGDPTDLTGYTAKMEIRRQSATGTLIDTFTNGVEITLGGALGTIIIVVTATVTAAYTAIKKAVWDLEMYPAGVTANSVRLVEGNVEITGEVTQ